MIRRLWYRYILKRPPIELEIRDPLGNVIGHLVITAGVFKGRIEQEKFLDKLEAGVRHRFNTSIKMSAVFEHPKRPWDEG